MPIRSLMTASLCIAGSVAAVLTVAFGPALAADAERGRTLYAACAACHSEKPDALGPDLKGVVGRKAAARDDFRYSAPMRRANLTWDEANLKAYILDPQATVRGNRMPFGGISEGRDVDDIVAYLKTLN